MSLSIRWTQSASLREPLPVYLRDITPFDELLPPTSELAPASTAINAWQQFFAVNTSYFHRLRAVTTQNEYITILCLFSAANSARHFQHS